MRTLFSRFCTLALGLTLAADAFAGAPNTCALWPIGYWEDQTIYYAEYHDDCPSEPIAAYLIGEYDWPLECGSTGCQWEKEVTALKAGDPTQTAGGLVLSRKWLPQTDEFVMPAGPARRFSEQVARTAVRFDHDGLASTPDKFAYCYLYHCNPKALGGLNESKFMTFGFEALEAPTDAKPAKVKGRIQNAAVHVEHEGTTYVIQLR
jgi:hypothetical protein